MAEVDTGDASQGTRRGAAPAVLPAELDQDGNRGAEAGGPERVRTLGVVAGRAPRFIEEAARRGLDVFLTGEPSEPAVHLAREERIHLVAAGHHAMERLGVQALGERLGARFGLQTCFIDDDNPV